MNVSDIQQSVTDLWRFLVPPVSILLCMSVITYYICGYSPVKLFQEFLLQLPDIQNEEIEDVLQFYGIDKLMPIITLFLIIFFLHASYTIFIAIGSQLPPYLSHDNNKLFIAVDGGTRLARIWAAHPNIQDFNTLCMMIEQESELEKDQSLREVWGLDIWKNIRSSNFLRFSSTKFLILWTFLSLILFQKLEQSFLYSCARFLIVILILLIVGISFILHYFEAVKQLGSLKILKVYSKVEAANDIPKEDFENNVKEFEKIIDFERSSRFSDNRRWMHLKFLNDNAYKILWLYRNP